MLKRQGSADKIYDRAEDDDDVLDSSGSLSQHSSMGNLGNVDGQASGHNSPSIRFAMFKVNLKS